MYNYIIIYMLYLHVPPYIGSKYTECLTKGIRWPPLQTSMWWYTSTTMVDVYNYTTSVFTV